jgi:hypothetical protein
MGQPGMMLGSPVGVGPHFAGKTGALVPPVEVPAGGSWLGAAGSGQRDSAPGGREVNKKPQAHLVRVVSNKPARSDALSLCIL